MRAFLLYVRLIVEYNYYKFGHMQPLRDIDSLESVQRCFTKWLPGLKNDRLQSLNVPTWELRLPRADLFWCYKIVFGLAHANVNEFFEFSPCHKINTRGHKYKLLSAKLLLVCVLIFFRVLTVNSNR